MKRYTQKEKNDALQLSLKMGTRQAAEQLNISYGSLLKWKREKNAAIDGADFQESSPQPDVDDGEIANEIAMDSALHPFELEVRLLRQEVAHLRAECTRQAKAIHELAPIE